MRAGEGAHASKGHIDIFFPLNFKEPPRKEASLNLSSQVNKAEYHTCILREKVDTFLVLLLL